MTLCMLMAFQVAAQDEGGENAPQVLTSDLASRQEVTQATVTATFVMVDQDNITGITIDGKKEVFQPGDTVSIKKTFQLKKGLRTITIEVQDEKGNKRVKRYLLAYGVPLPPQPGTGGKPPYTIRYIVEARMQNDSNPSLDWSIPLGLSPEDLGVPPEEATTAEGQIADSEQGDTRTVLTALASITYKTMTGFGGFLNTTYSKSNFEGLNSQVIFLGGQYKFANLSETGFFTGLTWMDVNAGGHDYSQNITLSGGYDVRSRGEEDERIKTVYSVDFVSKNFAPPSISGDPAAENGSQYVIKYDTRTEEAQGQDSARHIYSVGSNTEGFADSEFNYLRWRGKWENRWDTGLRVDAGADFQVRTFPNADGGRQDIRADAVVGVGWHFTKDISVMLNQRYVFNISLVQPYEKTVTGLAFKGAF